jgi:hypothetical protein
MTMTDDLVQRLRIGWHDDDTPLWVSNAMYEAADRIEALTERNQSLALDHLAAIGQAAEQIEALTAERDRLREAARFKPLVWFEAELPSRGGGKITAEGYTIRRIEGLWLLDFAGESKSVWRWADLQAAKAAAQADYEARILSALETEAQPDAEKLQ